MKENKPLISIITPAYNSECYITRCIESVLMQNFVDWEMVIVNDGSTDETKNILDKYATLDQRIHVHHLEHAGYCSVMNQLLKLCKGHYILSLDSDNWFDKSDTLLTISNLIEKTKAEIVQLSYRLVHDYGKKDEKIIPLISKDYYYDNYESIKKGIDNKTIYFVCHGGKAIKRELLDGLGFFGNPTGADSRLMALVIARANSYYCNSTCLLNVAIRKNSVSNTTVPSFSYYFDWISQEVNFFKFYEMLKDEKKTVFPQLHLFIRMFKKCIYRSSIHECHQTRKIRKIIWKNRKLFYKTYSNIKLFWFCKFPVVVKLFRSVKNIFHKP